MNLSTTLSFSANNSIFKCTQKLNSTLKLYYEYWIQEMSAWHEDWTLLLQEWLPGATAQHMTACFLRKFLYMMMLLFCPACPQARMTGLFIQPPSQPYN